jgi:hypothetical protein
VTLDEKGNASDGLNNVCPTTHLDHDHHDAPFARQRSGSCALLQFYKEFCRSHQHRLLEAGKTTSNLQASAAFLPSKPNCQGLYVEQSIGTINSSRPYKMLACSLSGFSIKVTHGAFPIWSIRHIRGWGHVYGSSGPHLSRLD